MENLEESVELSRSCYYTMLRSIVETLPRESTGDLLGRKLNEHFICVNSYPIQTANRKPKSVVYNDEKAVKRVRNLNRIVNSLGGLGTYLLGGYHSHVQRKDETIERILSHNDIKHASQELNEQKKHYWIEIILNIKEKKYQEQNQTGEFVTEHKRKLRVILRDTLNHAYEITISAYKVTNPKKPKIRELKVRKKQKPNSNPNTQSRTH